MMKVLALLLIPVSGLKLMDNLDDDMDPLDAAEVLDQSFWKSFYHKVAEKPAVKAEFLEESSVEEKPAVKLSQKGVDPKKKDIPECARDDKAVPHTSGGPRRVSFDETKEPGYFSKPVLKKITYLNQDYFKNRNQKMDQALHATLRYTKAGNKSTVEIERFKSFVPDDLKEQKNQLKLSHFSGGKFDAKAGADKKVVAIYLTWATALENIAKEAKNNSDDFKNVYILLEDDVTFGGNGIKDWADQVMCHLSKLPPDWDIYKFGSWGESLARRKQEGAECGHAQAYNEHSCQLKILKGDDQWEWMGNQGLAVRPRGAAAMLKYLKSKQVMDVDGAMLPTEWNPQNAPNYYTSRFNLVWHQSANNRRAKFMKSMIQRERQIPAKFHD